MALLALMLAVSVPVRAATLRVASNGVDAPGCGTKAAPCRSISRAVFLAGQGDTVEVGPGRYGDLAADGDFTDPGDEAAEIGTGCECVLHVGKRLTIVSRDGAGATVLDGGAAPADVVRLDAPGTVFGKKGKGFTVTGAGRDGIRGEADQLVLAGNVAAANGRNGIAVSADHVSLTDNRAVANGSQGYGCSGTNDSTLARNVASDNGSRGFTVDNRNTLTGNLATRNGDAGINAQDGNKLAGNVAVGNAAEGFSVNRDNVLTADVAHANHNGFRLDQGCVLTKSAVIGNSGVGILALESGIVVTKTSIFGNGGGAVNVPAPNANCGTLTADGVTLQATRNFWGAPAGPGADPADLACDGVGATTTVAPVAAREPKVRATAAR
jgi:parallel beta-helix repeat protein